MSYLDYILDTKKSESMQTFAEWNTAFDQQRAKESAAINATMEKVADSIRAQDASDLQADIEKAQKKVAEDIKASYIKKGRADDEKTTAAFKEMTSSIQRKIDKDHEAYLKHFGFLSGDQ